MGQCLMGDVVADCMFDGASKAADYQMRLFLGENYLRLQTPRILRVTIWTTPHKETFETLSRRHVN